MDNIDNMIIESDGIECPILDGSSKPYVDLLLDIGLKKLSSFKNEIIIDEIVEYEDSNLGIKIQIVPSNKFQITYIMYYNADILGAQYASYSSNKEVFINEIAPARTFCLLSEVKSLLKSDLIKGGNLDIWLFL